MCQKDGTITPLFRIFKTVNRARASTHRVNRLRIVVTIAGTSNVHRHTTRVVASNLSSNTLVGFTISRLAVRGTVNRTIRFTFTRRRLINVRLLYLNGITLIINGRRSLVRQFPFMVKGQRSKRTLFRNFTPTFYFTIRQYVILFISGFPPLDRLTSTGNNVPNFRHTLRTVTFRHHTRTFDLLQLRKSVRRDLTVTRRVTTNTTRYTHGTIIPRRQFNRTIITTNTRGRLISIYFNTVRYDRDTFQSRRVAQQRRHTIGVRGGRLAARAFVLCRRERPHSAV